MSVLIGYSESSYAGGSLAEFFYKSWNGDCPKADEIADREKILKDANECNTLQKTLVSQDFGKLSEFAVLSGIAGERAASLACSSKQVGATLASAETKEKILADALEKIRDIAKDREAMKPLVQTWASKDPLGKLEGKDSVDDQYRKLRARSEAALASMSFVELPEYKDSIEGAIAQLQAFNGREAPASVMAGIKSKLAASLASTKSNLDGDTEVMNKAVGDMGSSLNTKMRESLMQDQDLVASYLSKNKENEKSLKGVSCRLDAKYGKGASYRDTTVMVGSTILTGPGWGTLGKIGLTAIRATKLVTRGTTAIRSARVLKFTAVGIGETANLGNTIQEIHKACDGVSAQYSGHLAQDDTGTASCDTNVIKSLDSNNCYLAYGLGALGAVGTAAAGYSKVTDKWAARVAEKLGKAADPAREVVNNADRPAGAAGAANQAKGLTQADRQTLAQGFEELKHQAPVQDLKVAHPLEPVVLSANEVRKGGIANYMSRNQKNGIEYVFDDAKFAGKEDLVLSEGNRVYLRRKDGLHQLDSARSREAIVMETEKILNRIQCEKTGSLKDCTRAISYRAGYDSKFNLSKRDQEFTAGDREALNKSGRMSRNPDSVAMSEKLAEEEAMVLEALKKKWVNGLSTDRDEARKVLKERVHLSDGREVDIELPFGGANDVAHFKSLVDQRLNEAPIAAAAKRNEEKKFAWLERRRKQEAGHSDTYKPNFKVENGQVLSGYQPTKVIPRSSYPSQRTDAKYGGQIFRSVDDVKKFRESSEWRDGVHVFLQIQEKDKNGKDIVVWMEGHRIPNGKDFDDGKIVTHRTLAAEYERQTGHPPKIIAGGEYLADETRTLKQVGDGMGGYHDKELFNPTANFSADTLNAQGLHFAQPTEVSTGTLVQSFKASDGSSQMVGHYKAADEVRKAREIETAHPGIFKKNQVFARRVLENERKYVTTLAQKRAFVVKFLNSPAVKADTERFEAYRMISNLSKLMPESSTMATINTVEGIHLNPKLKRDIPGALKLIDKYADDYFRDMERVSRETPQ